MTRKILSVFTATIIFVSSSTTPLSTDGLLFTAALASSVAFEPKAGPTGGKHDTKCVKFMSKSRALGFGCLAAHYGYRTAIQILKAISVDILATEIEQVGTKVTCPSTKHSQRIELNDPDLMYLE